MVSLMRCLQQLGISSYPIATCLYLTTCTPGQLGKTWAFVRKVRQCPSEVQKLFQPPGLLDEFKKEFCEDDSGKRRTHTVKPLDMLNKFISEKNTLTGLYNTSRLVAIRLLGAKEEEHVQYTSGAHLLQWASSSILDAYSEGRTMQSLRILQIDGYLNGKEQPVPRLDKKKKFNKTRAKSGRKSSKDLIYQWIKNGRGQLALTSEVPISPGGVHTVKAIPSILNSLMNEVDSSNKIYAGGQTSSTT